MLKAPSKRSDEGDVPGKAVRPLRIGIHGAGPNQPARWRRSAG